MSDPAVFTGTWKLLHRGDPCILCQRPAAEVDPGGCTVTVQQLWSRIGHLVDAANAARELPGTEGYLEARRLEEEVKRLNRLHEVLTKDMSPATKDMSPAGEGS